MKKIIIFSLAFFCFSTTLFAQKKEQVKVWGNCGMCEKTIENAAKSAGAAEADWNKDSKVLVVAYKNKKTDLSKIEQAIAAAGYDTENYTASDEAYNKLHSCCQYARKEVASTNATADCCKNGKCEKHGDVSGNCPQCKDGGNTGDCCKEGKCGDCCKEGKCASSGKACCKKA